MLVQERISQLLNFFGNMVFNDDNKISPRLLEEEFPKWKQEALFKTYWGYKGDRFVPPIAANTFVNSSNFVKSKLTYKQSIQEAGADYVLFEVEPSVNLGDSFNGFSFVGDKLTGKPFTQLKSPNDYGVYKEAGLIGINDVCFYVSGGLMQVFGNTQVRSVFLNYIPRDVMNVDVYDAATKAYRLFDPEIDEYPISEDVWAVMKMLAIAELTPANLRPADYTDDNKGTIEKQINS